MSIFFAAPIDQWPNYDRVTSVPTCANTDPAFPASNLLTFDPTQPWRATTTNPAPILWDLGAARDFDVVGLLNTNLTDASTLVLEGSLDNSAWTTLHNGSALAHIVPGQTVQNLRNMLRRNHTLFNSATNRNFRYLRITPNSQVGGLFPSVGRLFVGKKFVPATGWQYDSTMEHLDLSPRERTVRGPLITEPMPPILTSTVKMEFLTKTEMFDFIYEFNYWRGASREMLACLDVEDTKYLQKNTLYCVVSEGRRISFDSYNTHSVNWHLENIAAS